ncbi:hypothetical protein [Brevundimonas viscosa]|uniref:Uncharacterized protein n=1 Tax=Brevundimonas viscosa TaxID=871741 RepID=A0A1I6Q029_9CAUL|nr:hypothetical protein [Brevundimonas viscosa]SFS45695.1 hypothetical protein SAMN05192570_1437 [Brevundimonas viscosa]
MKVHDRSELTIPYSRVRVLGGALLTSTLSVLLLLSFIDLDAYSGRYAHGFGPVLVAVITVGLIGGLLPATFFDWFVLWRRGYAARVADEVLTFYRGDVVLIWKRGYVAVPVREITSVEEAGPALRWGRLIRIRCRSGAVLMETFYSSGSPDEVIRSIQAAVGLAGPLKAQSSSVTA